MCELGVLAKQIWANTYCFVKDKVANVTIASLLIKHWQMRALLKEDDKTLPKRSKYVICVMRGEGGILLNS